LQCALVPERWNEHDANAVAVLIQGHHVGYLPADLARDYSPPLLARAAEGSLISGVARVWAKEEGGVARARVTICIPEAEVLMGQGANSTSTRPRSAAPVISPGEADHRHDRHLDSPVAKDVATGCRPSTAANVR
jgi:hypothetical protein